jgi:hypothetical protein
VGRNKEKNMKRTIAIIALGLGLQGNGARAADID